MAFERNIPSLQIGGKIDLEKYKAARTLGGSEVKFELRAMRPTQPGSLAISCLICLICVVCVVCSARSSEMLGIKLPELPEPT